MKFQIIFSEEEGKEILAKAKEDNRSTSGFVRMIVLTKLNEIEMKKKNGK